MSAYDNVDLSVFQGAQQLSPFFGSSGPGEARNLKARLTQCLRCVVEVLVRQDLGRGQDGGLTTIGAGRRGRQKRDRSLAGAHIPLQQPIHGGRLGHIGQDFAERSGLGPGQRERQQLLGQGFGGYAMGRVNQTWLFVASGTGSSEGELKQQQLIERQSTSHSLNGLAASGPRLEA